jgi:hypothetical protein
MWMAAMDSAVSLRIHLLDIVLTWLWQLGGNVYWLNFPSSVALNRELIDVQLMKQRCQKFIHLMKSFDEDVYQSRFSFSDESITREN